MLVTFKTHAFSNITMFGDVATDLLKLMGQSGNVPGALLAEDVKPALETLQEGLKSVPVEEPPPPPENKKAERAPAPVPLAVRAKPLMDLLEAAHAEKDSVSWDEGA